MKMRDAESRQTFGNGGWVLYEDEDWPSVPETGEGLYLRFAPDEKGRLRVVDLFAAYDRGLSNDALRRLRLGRLEAMANEPDARSYLIHGIKLPSPDLRRLVSFFGTSFEYDKVEHWVAKSFLAQKRPEQELQPTPPRRRAREGERKTSKERKPEQLDPRLELLSDRPPYSDAFYEEVARKYVNWAARSPRPAEVLARANDVPVRRIHSWVKEARKRGYLGSGRRGAGG
jgi:hypothetical protein